MGSLRKIIGSTAVIGATAGAVSRWLRHRTPALPEPAAGDSRTYAWRHAPLVYTVRGEGPPALLIHDLYAGASGDEMVPLADRLAERFTLHTADLPGFGRSGHPAMRYGPDLFFDAIVELVRHAIDAPTLLIGSGLGAAYATEAATRLGDLATGVVLLGPPEPEGTGMIETPTWRPLAYQLLRSPLGESAHYWNATIIARRRALARDLAAEPPDLDVRAEALHRHARQPRAWWPLWSLWAGDLAWDPRPALARLGAPALVLWGSATRGNPAAPACYREVRPDIEQHVVPHTARWPHVDDPAGVADRIDAWWAAGERPA